MVRKQDLVSDTDSFVNSVEDSLDILSSFDTRSSRKTWPQSAPEVSNLGHSSLYSDLAHVFLEISDDRIAAKALAQLEGDRAQTILDTLQTILDSEHTSITSGNRARILYLTLQLAKRSGLYPQSLHLTDVTREDTHAVTAGHFGEIWKGRFRGRAVCMKVLKVYQRSDVTKLLRLFAREGILWSHLSHENLLPFYGFHRLDDDAGRMCLISPWAEHGCVRDYLQRNPDVNRYSLVRDSCQGLLYLHNHGIIHGDLKGVNILVTKSGRACVADFGLSAVAESEIMKWTSLASSAGVGGTVRWQAPELFDPNTEEAKPTKMSDVYSLGCVFYEIFTGEIPFHEVSRESTVISHMQSGRQPSKPSPDSLPFSTWGLSEEVWNSCIHQSWSRTPEERPTIPYLLRRLAAVEAAEGRRRGSERRGASSGRPPEAWLTAAEVRNSIRMSRGRDVRSGRRPYVRADGGLPSWNEPTRWLQWLRTSA
ncbi:kinase-like domain-containing protein [Ephemerocybe angulata]|uniref:Kinase-like domain-containing protein n=1 Tax=Ephemerocybe angulata TaxID=980116 RepID=A0A8H6LT43_9AGAR|nr:kinase-like domain-containing protein [Tulosesus angulatus]